MIQARRMTADELSGFKYNFQFLSEDERDLLAHIAWQDEQIAMLEDKGIEEFLFGSPRYLRLKAQNEKLVRALDSISSYCEHVEEVVELCECSTTMTNVAIKALAEVKGEI
jgi:hypothetical protein